MITPYLQTVRLCRLNDKDFPLRAALAWDPERFHNYRMVLQENETGEIVVSGKTVNNCYRHAMI